jgi:hypothetical protein
MPEPRDLLTSYREVVQGLRRAAGPVGALFTPLELTADVLEQVLERQQALEAQLAAAMQPLVLAGDLAREAPTTLRTQAKAFEAAAASFHQVAELLNVQADLLEKTVSVLAIPKGMIPRRGPGGASAD